MWCFRGGMVQQLPKVLCPSPQLFLGCRQWVSIFILHWLDCLPEFTRQLLGYQVQVFEVPLSGCFLCLTGQVFDVISFVLPNVPLHFFLFFLASNFWMVSAEIHSLCWVAFLPRTSSHVLCQSFSFFTN